MIRYVVNGNFNKTENFLKRASNLNFRKSLDRYGKEGVSALSYSTPVDTGKTASSWNYEIEEKNGNISVIWTNSNINKGVNIALIIQLGHGTGTGAYVQGIDYINPALRSIFEKMADEAWKEVTS